MSDREWTCGPECPFWRKDTRRPDLGWCDAPIPLDLLFSVGDMLHTNKGDECGWTLEQMIQARDAWEPVIAARRAVESQQTPKVSDNAACGAQASDKGDVK